MLQKQMTSVMSWKASVPMAPVGTWPEKMTMGTPSVRASSQGVGVKTFKRPADVIQLERAAA